MIIADGSNPRKPEGPQARLATPSYKIVRKRVSSLKPSPENIRLYRAIDSNDPDNIRLDKSIRTRGLQEPLVITLDNFIVSGNRRHASLLRIGQRIAPCRVLDIRHDSMSTDEILALLREHNVQRNKDAAEQVREQMVDIDPTQAHEKLRRLRDKSVYALEHNNVVPVCIEGSKVRHNVSGQKAEHVKYVKKIIFEDRKDYWPLSVRGIHYPLLNYKFLRNIPRKLAYENDDNSYNRTSDLLTRLRLTGEIPWEAIDDPTRPLTDFRPFSDVRQFVRQEVKNLFGGYWRDLLQTQPNHVEVLVEKNTIYQMVLRVTRPFQIPTSSGRGFNSIDPWHDLYQRYQQSGKERLIVVVLSDFDPEGEMIPQVGGRTLRDDFGVDDLDLEIIKAGVTRDQIDEHNLPPQNFAKESSSNFDWFVDRNDGDNTVYELEALDPAVMLRDLRSVITSVLDLDLFNLEARREQDEAVYLEAVRATATEALKGVAE
jgi:hypothetical protein